MCLNVDQERGGCDMLRARQQFHEAEAQPHSIGDQWFHQNNLSQKRWASSEVIHFKNVLEVLGSPSKL